MRKPQPPTRPSMMSAMKKGTDIVEQNKNTRKGSNVSAAFRQDSGTGKLVSLGLSKYRAEDFTDDTLNPFTIQPNTEKMLVMRELEREYRDLNKYQKDSLKVHEKQIATRNDGCGALRRIEEIPPSKQEHKKSKNLVEDDSDNATKQKLNIFDA